MLSSSSATSFVSKYFKLALLRERTFSACYFLGETDLITLYLGESGLELILSSEGSSGLIYGFSFSFSSFFLGRRQHPSHSQSLLMFEYIK